MPPAIRRIASELGLRFRPASGALLEDHQTAVALLAEDLADVPPAALEAAAKQWVQTSRFMPRAADLVSIAQASLDQARSAARSRAQHLQERVDSGNVHLDSIGRHDVRWVIDHDGVRLMDVAEINARNERLRNPCTAEDVRRILAEHR